MSVAGIGKYRLDVRGHPCPDCGAGEGELCRKIDGRGRKGSLIEFVHEGRSFVHHVETLSDLWGNENF